MPQNLNILSQGFGPRRDFANSMRERMIITLRVENNSNDIGAHSHMAKKLSSREKIDLCILHAK